MPDEIDHPHDRLFRTVFSDATEAAGLLQTALPAELREEIDWSTLNLRDGTFLDEALRESESDLLYEAAYREKGESRERDDRNDRCLLTKRVGPIYEKERSSSNGRQHS